MPVWIMYSPFIFNKPNERYISGSDWLFISNEIFLVNVPSNEKINKLNAAKQCIKVQNNTLDSADSYYYSMVSSYLASYNYTTFKYDNQINEYQKQIDTYEVQIRKAEEENTSNETVSSNEVVVGNEVNNVEVLKKQRDVLNISIESVKKEKMQ